jgi:hypothetical protein
MSLSNNEQNGPQQVAESAATNERLGNATSAATPAASQEGPAASTAAGDPSNVERAEEITYKVAEKAAHAASACVRGVAWLFASAREAAQDVWAEAQSVRRGDKNS